MVDGIDMVLQRDVLNHLARSLFIRVRVRNNESQANGRAFKDYLWQLMMNLGFILLE